MNWQPISTAPTEGPDILVAIPVYGSSQHREFPKKFLRWEYAVIETGWVGSETGLECGWSPSDFTHWAPLNSPPQLPQ